MKIDIKKVKSIKFAESGEHQINFRATEGDEFADGYADEFAREHPEIAAENDAFESLNDAIQNDASDADYETRRAIYADILRKRGTLNEEYEKTRKREE